MSTQYDLSQLIRATLFAGVFGGLVGFAISLFRTLPKIQKPEPKVIHIMQHFFENKVAVVTGSTSGVGEAVARRLVLEGAKVVINSSKSVEVGLQLAKELGPNVLYVQADVSKEGDAEKLISETISKFGKLDFLINNAGTTKKIDHANFDAVTTDLWNTILTTNVIGPWNLSKLATPYLKKTNGHIINMASVGGLRPMGSCIPYSCSKAALIQLTFLLAKALDGVQVNVVCPGLIKTPWTSGDDWTSSHEHVTKTVPLHRVGEPEDIAEGVLGLLRNSYVSGAVLTIDGGMLLRMT